MEWINIYRGIVIGASNVVPGISGGTLALALGIYDRLILSISRLFSKDWKNQIKFLISLGIGGVIAIFLFANGLQWLFKYHPLPTQYAFIGLIIGVFPILLIESGAKTKFKKYHYLLFVIGIVLVAALNIFQGDDAFVIADLNLAIYGYLFLAGLISGGAMLLPGISGALVLLVIGAYGTVIQAVATLQIDILIVVGLGFGAGVMLMSKVISYFLNHYPHATYAIILGLVIGSIYVIFPGWPTGLAELILSSLALLIGVTLAFKLGRVEHKTKE